MVEFNRQDRVVRVKIAYYGPAVGGKTTNLKVLYDRARGGRRGEFVSVNSQQDRTILCDLLPLKSGGFRGFDLRFQLAAVPGQAIYAPARRVVLRGSDGVVFVANSATDRWHENLQSFRELQGHLLAQQIDPMKIPTVLQYNKRDLPDVLDIEALEHGMNSRRVPHYPAVAVRGEGVLETFAAIVRLTLEDLARRHPAIALPEPTRYSDTRVNDNGAPPGTMAMKPVITPSSTGEGTPKIASPIPASSPCTIAVPTRPKTTARTTDPTSSTKRGAAPGISSVASLRACWVSRSPSM